MLRGRLEVAGEVPGPEAKALETALMPHSEKSGRSGPDRGAAPHAPGDDPHAQTERRAPTASGENPADPLRGVSAPETDLSQVTVEDLMDELHNRGFIMAKPDEGRPEPIEVPAIEAIYTEVLAQELERRGWECFPPDGPDA